MNDTDLLIKIENLDKEFAQATGCPLKVLDKVVLEVFAGDAIAIMGPNGSGKSTLLRVVEGGLAPTSGKIYLAGKDATNKPAYVRARFIGSVHQESYKSLASDLTVEETLALAARRNTVLSLKFPSVKQILNNICGFSEKALAFIDPRLKLATKTLSGGQRQLLATIVAVLGQPRVLLLDEHLASLDEEFKTIANELTRGFVCSGGAFVAVTHDRQWAEDHVQRIFCYRHGTFSLELLAS